MPLPVLTGFVLTIFDRSIKISLVGSSKSTDAPQGNLYGDVGIGSAYFKDKLEMLKHGVHINTQTPYTYDENGDPVYEQYKPA